MRLLSESIEIPFGNHKGELICNLSTSYLDWLLQFKDTYNLDDLLTQTIELELNTRSDWRFDNDYNSK